MTSTRSLRLTSLLVLLTACGGEEPPPPPAEPAAAPEAPAPTTGPVRIAGRLLVGENTAEFEPCDGGDPLWLDGPLTADLVALHAQMTPGVEPFEAIYVDLVADLGPPPAMGPGARYPGAVIAHLLRRAAFEGWDCTADDPTLRFGAEGTEPFWSLRATVEEAVFSTPEQRLSLDLGSLEMDGEGWVVQGTLAGGGNLFVTLTELPCRNAMSGAYSHLTAEVQMDGQRLQGCGWIGAAADPDAG